MLRLPQEPIHPCVSALKASDGDRLIVEPIGEGNKLFIRVYDSWSDEVMITEINPKNKSWKTTNYPYEKWGTASILGRWNRWTSAEYLNKELIEHYLGTYDIQEWQDEIMECKRIDRKRKRDRKTYELMDQAIPLPEQYRRWVDNNVFKEYKYIQYKVSRKKETEAYCTSCGSSLTIPTKGLKTGKSYVCPICHKRVELRAEGRCKGLIKDHWTQIFQSVDGGQGGMVRYLHWFKNYSKFGQVTTWHDETMRIALRNGKEECYEWRSDQGDYYEEKWCRNRQVVALHPRISWPVSAKLWKGNLKRELQKTKYRYAPVEEWLHDSVAKFNLSDNRRETFILEDVLKSIERYPFIESLWKIGMTELANGIRERGYKANKGTELHKILGISKEQFRADRKCNAKDHIVSCQKGYLEQGIEISVDQAKQLSRNEREEKFIGEMCKRFGTNKTLKYVDTIDKQDIRVWVWEDYYNVGQGIGYDLEDLFVAMPRDLQVAHDQAIAVRDEEKERKKLERAETENKGVATKAKKWEKHFAFEKDGYLIRIAKSNLELVKEGQTLHHCVGGGSYARKMEREESFILFLRKSEEPNEPYTTIEITKDFKIIQWYQKYDKKPDKDIIQPWLDEYLEEKKNVKKHHAKSA